MTPSHYESYIQIYKSAEEAVKQYARFQELKRKDDDPDDTLSKAEKKEYAKNRPQSGAVRKIFSGAEENYFSATTQTLTCASTSLKTLTVTV